MFQIIKTESDDHNKAFNKALDYIFDIYNKNNFLPGILTLYGDGSRWKPLSYKGFELVYKSVKEAIETNSAIQVL